MDHQAGLKNLERRKEFLIAIDSDGCVFDTMEIKHKECFIPNIIKHWGLQPVSKFARAASEFVNLYSQWRGVNRFPALIKTFDLLEDWPEVQQRNPEIPEAGSLRSWIEGETALGNPRLREIVEQTGDQVLSVALEWSEAVNRAVADMVEGIPPFPSVVPSLEKIEERADVIVCSGTPVEALHREWSEHGIDRFTRVIAGQEMGSKKEHIALASGGKFAGDQILMVGDAPGDMRAAKANHARFFPIVPGREEASWERFLREGADRFLKGEFSDAYEAELIEEFQARLPETPPWKE